MESLPLVLCAVLLGLGLGGVVGFNVDMENFVKYRGPSDSMFGFSVAEYRGWDRNWVLVGAPAAQTDQPGVLKGGAVYRCHSADDRCQVVTFDPSGNTRNSSGHEIDKKSRQWFGATVHTSGGTDGVIVACAPRYTYFSQSAPEYREDPVGTCYVARDDFRTFLEYSPCRTAEWGYHRQGSCQAGLGAAVSKDGQRLFIGAPGSWYWQGRLYSVNSKVKLDWFYPIYNFSYPPGRLYSQNLNEHLRPDVIATLEGPEEDDDSYLGYSVAEGDFTGEGDNGAAVGMPRGAMLFGKVILFSSKLKNIGAFRGEQLGAYFGYSVCVADVDGDNLDDLIVGAPMFTHLHNNEGKYETGRIHIMYQKKESKWFQDTDFRDGKNSKSRFGLSLCSLGDINKDGFGDIAVGAPYDGPKGGGAVYLYHGSEKGLMKDPSQIIYGETVSPSISTFGFSISGGNDLDNNEYPDIVIGAYEKDLAFFFKSRPIIKMKSDIKVGPESKLISLDDKNKNCVLRDGTLTTCTFVSFCMEYNGIGVEPKHEFEIQLTLDSKKQKGPRMFFRANEGLSTKNFTVSLEQRNRKCNRHEVYIKPGIKDKLTALEVEMRYELRHVRRRPTRSLLPILDQGRPAVDHDSISIQKNCGPDNICIPDLNLSATPSVSKYLLGSGERFDIEAKVVNYGEDAFESVFNLRIPPGLNFTRIERLPDDDREIPVQCSAPDAENNNTLKCDIGNPLPQHKHVHFKVLMQPFYKENLKSRYEFYVDVNSTNPENKSSTKDNKKEFSVPIIINSDISITGSSSPIELYYNTTHYNVVNVTQESEIGPQLNHSYTIFNTGPSDIVEAEVYILWPMYTLQGEPLFYILEQPEVDGPAVCEKLEEANSLQLQLDHRRKSGIKQAHTGKFSKSSESGRRISVKETSHSKGSAASSGKWKEKNFEDKGTDNSKSKSNGRDFSTSYEHQSRNAGGSYGGTRNENEQSYFQNRSSGGWSDGPAKDGQIHGYSSYNYSYSASEGGKPTKHYSNYSVTNYGDGSQIGSSTNWSSENTNDKNSNIGYSESENKQKTLSLSGSSSEVSGSSLGSESHIGGVRFIPAIKRTGVGYDAVTVSGSGGFRTGVIDSHGGVHPFSTNTGTSHHTTLDEISKTQAGQANSQEGSHYYSSTWSKEGSSRSESSRKQGNSDNSKQIVRHYSSTTGSDGEVRHYNPSTDIAWEERYRHTIDSGKNSHTNDDYDDEDDLDDEYDESYSEEETTNTNNNDNHNNNRDSETDKNFKLYSRYTREVNGEDNFDQLLECNSTQCVKFKCSIKRFTRGQEININIRSRVWVQTLKKISFNVPANVSSMLAMQVIKLPYIGQPDNPIIRSLEVFTTVISTDTTIKPDIVPLWVVVLSACAGAIILLLLILLLWKCGFFKRNRPTDAPEKEPLNRNGHYSNGDEAL